MNLQKKIKSKSKQIVFGHYILKKLIRNEADCIKSFVAVQKGLDRLVEIRILTVSGGSDSLLAKRFVEEVKVLTSVSHRSVLTVLDQGVISGKLYFTTPLHHHLRIREYLDSRTGSLPQDTFLRFAEILADAVAYLHKNDKIHRGISAKSIFVEIDEDEAIPYIGECSVMRDIREQSLTALGLPVIGESIPTPEEMIGNAIDKRTDVFLLSVLFYEMLSGHSPLPATREDILNELSKTSDDFIPIVSLDTLPGCGCDIPGVCELIMKGLEADPNDRFPDAFALAEALRKVAKRYEIQLFVREMADNSVKLNFSNRAPVADDGTPLEGNAAVELSDLDAFSIRSVLKRIPEKWILRGGSVVVIFLLILLGMNSFSFTPAASETVKSYRPLEVAKQMKQAVSSKCLLELSQLVKKNPTSEDSFSTNIETFRSWLVSQGGGINKVCTYRELVTLRLRYKKKNNEKSLMQLDTWIIEAAEGVSEVSSP